MTQIMPHWLTKQAKLSPNKIAIEHKNGTLTFSQLKRKSEAFAKKLVSLGVKKHKAVAILSPNKLDMVIAIHALSYLEALVVMLNIRLTKKELEYQIDQSEVSFIITTEELRKDKALQRPLQKTYEEIHAYAQSDVELATEINLSEPFTMMFTSGTTGLPKAVVHTYGNHWWSAISSALNLGLHKEDKWLLTLPMFHVSGLSTLIKSVVYGMTVYVMEKYDAKTLYETLVEKNITIASLVTLMLHQLLDTLNETEFPPHVRCILLGGGSVPEHLLQLVKKKKIPLYQSYGMTETSSQIVTINADDALVQLGSSGKPLFPAQIKIDQPDEHGIGEILVKGPMVMNGYLNNPKANEASFQNDWFKTGDLGYINEEGFLFVVDRRSDLIISGGENIYPSEIENAILQLDIVKEAAVVGKVDDVWGQVPVAFIVLKQSETLSEEEMHRHLETVLAPFKIPKQFYVVDLLPKNASNKIMRHKLQAKL